MYVTVRKLTVLLPLTLHLHGLMYQIPDQMLLQKKKVPRLPLHANVRYRASPLKTTCSFNHRQGAFVAGTVFTFTPTNSPIEVLWQLTVM